MARMTLRPGDQFLRGTATLSIIDIQPPSNIVIEDIATGRRQTVTRYELERSVLKSELTPAQFNLADDTPIDLLSEKDFACAKRREAYVKALDSAAVNGELAPHIDATIQSVSKAISDPKPPSPASIYRWYGTWVKAGKCLSALAPKNRRKGNRTPRISKELRLILMEFLDRHYLILDRPKLSQIIKRFRGHIRSLNMSRSPSEQHAQLSPASIYRFVTSLDPYEIMARRYGKRAADNHFRKVGLGLKVEAPLDVVQMDHTKLDILVLAPTKNLIARPWITIAFDVFSRMPVGVYIGFVPPSFESVMLCLRVAIQNKDQLLSRFPSIGREWQCHGLMRTILLDNALEFHSQSLQDACNHLGVHMVYHPVREPHYKGSVERFFRTLNDSFLSGLKGRTFSNTMEKGDYDAVGSAVIPFETFQEALLKWIVDVYPYNFHRGIEDFPADAWNAGVARFPVDLPDDMNHTLILLSQKVRRTLTSRGIELHNTFYQCDELHSLFLRQGENRKVFVKRDPTDLGQIFVFDTEGQRFITVPCIDPDFVGLSLWQHALVRRLVMAKKGAGEEKYNVAEQVNNIWRFIDQNSQSNKKRVNSRQARMTEYGRPTNTNLPEPGQARPPLHLSAEPADLEKLLAKAAAQGWDDQDDDEDEG